MSIIADMAINGEMRLLRTSIHQWEQVMNLPPEEVLQKIKEYIEHAIRETD